MNKNLVIDRFEDNYAVCETVDKRFINILRELLPSDAKEGDFLVSENGSYAIDTETTEAMKKRIAKKMNDLWE